MLNSEKRNIVLIGMPGTGKSTVGVVLAKHLGYAFMDTDINLAQSQDKTLCEIIEEKGYNGFLEIEGEVGSLVNCQKTVIATGGSMPLSHKAMENLSAIGTVVWLDTEVSELEKRLERNLETRGVATDKEMTVREIYEFRKPYYSKWADITINCQGEIEDVILEILKKLK